MQQKTIIKKLGECLSIDAKNIRPETRLAELDGWDAVGRLLVLTFLGQHFKKTIDQSALTNCRTIADIIELVKEDIEK